MSVKRSKNFWDYKNSQRRRRRVSTAIHEARWGKPVAALLICIVTFLIVWNITSVKTGTDYSANAGSIPNNTQTAQASGPLNTQEGKLNIAMLGNMLQQGAADVATPAPEQTAPPTESELPDVDVPIISHVPREGANPAVALTFDDGPTNVTTPRLLDALKEKGVKATFFTLGFTSPNTDKTLRRIADEGHELGNHSWSHQNLRSLSDEEQFKELDDNQQLIKSVGGQGRYIRPPFGKYDKRVLHYAYDHGCSIITWNIDPEDYKYKDDPDGAQKIVDHVLENVKDGDIILLHDIYGTSVDAAIKLLDELPKHGYQIITVNELLNR